ncbi:response regulator [Pyxidicoccus parkwayensis]|uniref:Response regulator n=1 Tax=Pyxidicoccus parkwayensis TaxID=2813578 RepID=A0ABX7NK23_9BACT|nr:response regulator [Pyxidicoccus parkwaysis]QSQ19181.1 response regulator [Pyxidicoccus parkwaysis]
MRSADTENASILLVDDIPANLVALEAILVPLGQRLVLARSGREALAALLQQDFACILLDVQMPGMDGFETARLIKGRERTRHVPILFITAFSSDDSLVQRGYAQGAVDYIVKPFNPDMLRTKVAVFVDLYLQAQHLNRHSGLLRDREREVMEREAEERLRAAALDELQLAPEPLVLTDALMAVAPVPMVILSPDLRVLRVNDAWARLWETSASILVGRRVSEVAPALAQDLEAPVSQVLSSGRPLTDLHLMPTQRDVSPRHARLLASYFPLSLRAGAPSAVGVLLQTEFDELTQPSHPEAQRSRSVH